MKHLFGLTLTLLLMASVAQAQRRMALDTLPPEHRDEILQRHPRLATGSFTAADLDEVLRDLARTGRYESLVIVKKGADQFALEYDANRSVREIQITGNNQVSDSTVLDQLDFGEGDFFRRQSLEIASERLTEMYRQRAFLQAKVLTEFERLPNNEVRVRIHIEEGQRAQVHRILLKSANQDLSTRLERHLRRFRGRAITEPNLAEIRDRATDYLREQGYYQASIRGPELKLVSQGAELQYSVQNPTRFNVSVLGNQGLTTTGIIRGLELHEFFSPNPSIAEVLENRIEQYYLQRGYAHIEVESEVQERNEPFLKALVFRINEGPRVQVQELNIRGSISRPPSYYTEILDDAATPVAVHRYYNRQDVESALSGLMIQLQNEGYLQAKVTSFRAEYSEDKSKVKLSINLNEGPLTQVQEILFEGNDAIADSKLRELVRLQPRSPLQLHLLEEDIEQLKRFYKDEGFLEVSIINEKKDLVRYNADHTMARIVFELKEGPKIQVGDILLEGNELTKDYVILNELNFEKGDVLTPEKISESIRRLQGAGYFGNVDIRMLEAQSDIEKRTIIVSVTERKPGLLNFGTGVTNERGVTLRGYTGIAYRNLYGTGRALTARLDGKYNVSELQYPEYQVSAGYLEPYLFNSRVRGRVNVTRLEQVDEFFDLEVDGRQVTELNVVRTDQVAFSLEHDITPHMLLRWNVLELSSSQQFFVEGTQDSITQNIATTGPSLDIDYRNHPFNPTSGSHTLLNFEYSSPALGSSPTIEFARSNASFTHYWQVYKSVVWANSLRGGYLKNLSDHPNGGIPYDRKGYFLGGAGTLRGFDGRDERFPLPQELTGDPELVDYVLKDSSTYYLVKTEVRFPLYWILSGALFFDGGQVTIPNGPHTYDGSFRSAVGFALRFGTPVGPVNFEYGFKLNPREDRGETPGHWHFSIGTF